jgi:DNA-binding XRE family transcriptional regulator
MHTSIRKPSSVSELLRTARVRRGYTQERAAAWFSCTDRTIKHWEAGRRPQRFWKQKIAKFAGISMDRLDVLWIRS